jgi:hypothetical protein
MREDFEHHDRATNVLIYVYHTETKARAQSGGWISSLTFTPLDDSPHVSINHERLRALRENTSDKFGLSEGERERAFRDSIQAERRAANEASQRFNPASQFENLS